jgi:hypothetical protein
MHLPRTVNHTKWSTTIAPAIGASTIWSGAVTKKKKVAWAKTAWKSKLKAAISMQPPLQPPPLATPSGTTSLQTCIGTWQMNDSSNRHGLGGPHSGYFPWPRQPSTTNNKLLLTSSSRYYPLFLSMVWVSPQDHGNSTLQMLRVASITPPNLPFLCKALQEETLHEIILAGKQGTSTSSTIHTFIRGTHLPLLPVALIAYKVGCWVKHSLNGMHQIFQHPQMLQRIAYQSKRGQSKLLPMMHFDTNSFLIDVDSFVLVTMATQSDQFEDLTLNTGQSVQGIEGGLASKGHGTFKFNIEDDKGTVHSIKIPNSMYVPDLKYCLLSPQHWAQKAKDSAQGTIRMETDTDGLILIWGQGKHWRTIPCSRDTNTQAFCTAPAMSTYRVFSAHVKAMEAQFHRWEQVIMLPGCCRLLHDRDRFLSKDIILLNNEYRKTNTLVSEGASPDDETIKASNLSTETSDEDSGETETTQVGPLTFNPTPQLEDDKGHQHAATDNQAELMRWQYCLGHLSFPKLKK